MINKEDIERFKNGMGPLLPNGCIEWNRKKCKGVPSFLLNGKVVHVHRVAYLIFVGEIPRGKQVVRKCNNKYCVNPAHLVLSKTDPHRWSRLSIRDLLKMKSAVNHETGCIEWTASKDSGGYGLLVYKGKQYKAHRLAYEDRYGPILSNLDVLHACDNPSCINPEHLFLGDDLVNRADCCKKGRQSRGEHRPNHKLTEKQVLEIRRLHNDENFSVSELGRMFHVDSSHICKIIKHKKWAYLSALPSQEKNGGIQ